MPDHPSRRALLVAAAALGVGGCTAGRAAVPRSTVRPGVLQQTVRQARADAATLRASALALAGTWSTGRALAERIAADHAAHLAALGAPRVPSTASPATSASPGGSPGPSIPPVHAGDQLDDEWSAARAALTAGVGTEPGGLALLLVRIAAARAVHADLLAAASRRSAKGTLTPAEQPVGSPTAGPSASPSPTPSPGSVLAGPTEKALNRLLAGEHAAVYVYPIVIARTTGSRRRLAQDGWARHQQIREALSHRLLSAGVVPAESQPAYSISPMPTSAGQAEDLAATVERRLAALEADVVATAGSAPDRAGAADRLVAAARSAAAWSGRADALPGGVASTATPTPSPSRS